MHYFLQDILKNETGFKDIIRVLNLLNIPYSIHKVTPFSGIPVDDLPDVKNAICFGSYSFAKYVNGKYIPGAFLKNLSFEIQLYHWKENMFNYDSVISSFKDSIINESSFIRPVDDSKSFSGTIMNSYNFKVWKDAVLSSTNVYDELNENTLVMICPIKIIYAEYRFWIIKGRVITYSQYKLGDIVTYSSSVPEYVIEFAQNMADKYCPNEAFCLDVFESDSGLYIGEVNNINSAGFYAADIQKLIFSLESM